MMQFWDIEKQAKPVFFLVESLRTMNLNPESYNIFYNIPC